MAVETLYASQREAADLMGVDFSEVDDMQQPRLAMADTIMVDGEEIPVFRAHSGPEDDSLIAKGGIRMNRYPTREAAVGTVKELAVEMLSKVALRGHGDTFMGGKGLILISYTSPLAVRKQAVREFEHRMEDAGLAGYDRDVPAGDVGVGSVLTDTYADEYHDRNPDDPRWQGCITGKSPGHGGTAFRPAATGYGTYITQRTLMDSAGQDRSRTTVQGFGNVGGYHAYFASNDPEGRMPVDAISDADGILYTDDPAGIAITEAMVRDIANNPDFKNDPRFAQYQGQKITALSDMVSANQPGLAFDVHPNSAAIISRPTDYFVPAAMGNVITGHNVLYLGAREGVIEAGNGVTTPAAHRYLTARGLLMGVDIVANGAGVDGSIQEWAANLRDQSLPADVLRANLAKSSEALMLQTLAAAEALGTSDLRVAAAGLGIARILERRRPKIIKELLGAAA